MTTTPQPTLLIADAGTTKTDWCLVTPDNRQQTFTTQGINPLHSDQKTITHILTTRLLPQLPPQTDPLVLHYYGAGCLPDKCIEMQTLFRSILPLTQATVNSDVLGAARALFDDKPGICCILGTGSAACLYDGRTITRRTPSLGYILGDEGSGTALGKRLLGDVFKNILHPDLSEAFHKQYPLTETQLIQQIYRGEEPGRTLASFVPFLKQHHTHPQVKTILSENFAAFFHRNVVPLQTQNLSVGFVGGVANAFPDQLHAAALDAGFTVAQILQRPIERLVQYHTRHT